VPVVREHGCERWHYFTETEQLDGQFTIRICCNTIRYALYQGQGNSSPLPIFLRRRQQQEPPRPGSQQLPHLSNDCSLPPSVSLPALLRGIAAIETSFAFGRVKDRTVLPPLSHFP